MLVVLHKECAVYTGVLPNIVDLQKFFANCKAAMTMFVLRARLGLQTANTCREILSRIQFYILFVFDDLQICAPFIKEQCLGARFGLQTAGKHV